MHFEDTRLRGQNNKRRKGTFQLLLVKSLSIKCESDKYVYGVCIYLNIILHVMCGRLSVIVGLIMPFQECTFIPIEIVSVIML